jgi:uncharacterized iron-regulated membrane protein
MSINTPATVLADVRWQHYGNVARATEMGVMLHEGKLFGSLNQIAILLVCLMILLSSVSGLVIWWKRRPQGRLGVPPLRHDAADLENRRADHAGPGGTRSRWWACR